MPIYLSLIVSIFVVAYLTIMIPIDNVDRTIWYCPSFLCYNVFVRIWVMDKHKNTCTRLILTDEMNPFLLHT